MKKWYKQRRLSIYIVSRYDFDNSAVGRLDARIRKTIVGFIPYARLAAFYARVKNRQARSYEGKDGCWYPFWKHEKCTEIDLFNEELTGFEEEEWECMQRMPIRRMLKYDFF